jgi:hypothetical protein
MLIVHPILRGIGFVNFRVIVVYSYTIYDSPETLDVLIVVDFVAVKLVVAWSIIPNPLAVPVRV